MRCTLFPPPAGEGAAAAAGEGDMQGTANRLLLPHPTSLRSATFPRWGKEFDLPPDALDSTLPCIRKEIAVAVRILLKSVFFKPLFLLKSVFFQGENRLKSVCGRDGAYLVAG